jgi:hypothetical protein
MHAQLVSGDGESKRLNAGLSTGGLVAVAFATVFAIAACVTIFAMLRLQRWRAAAEQESHIVKWVEQRGGFVAYISGRGLVSAEALFARVTYVNLDYRKVTDADLQPLMELEQVDFISLAGTQVTDDGVAQLAQHKSCVCYNFSECGITDEALRHLAQKRDLRFLILSDTPATDEGLMHLSSCRGLRNLTIYGSNFSDQAVDRLKAALPRLKVNR